MVLEAALRRTLSLVLALVPLCWLACSEAELCESSSQVEIPSPDGKLAAWVFIRGCGPTTPSSVHVSVLAAGTPALDEPGNVFALEPVAEVEVRWTSERELSISRAAGGRVLRQEPRAGEVAVTYAVD